jgi:hypothetical protein
MGNAGLDIKNVRKGKIIMGTRTETINECVNLLQAVLKQTKDTFKDEYNEYFDITGKEKVYNDAYCEGLQDAIKKIRKLKD